MTYHRQSLRLIKVLSKQHHLSSSSTPRCRSLWSNGHVANIPSLSVPMSNEDGRKMYYRKFNTKVEEKAEDASASESDIPQPEGGPVGDEVSTSTETSEENEIAKLERQIKDLKDSFLRSLAEQENTRRIAKRDVEQARSFAITSFAKSLLDTSDNLSRALNSVPEDLRHDHENHPVLATLYEGITMTDEGLTKAFAKNGLVKFGEPGEKFDPNKHDALFEYPDPNNTPGNIGQVMKVGFMLNDRVVRPAEVGVVKA